MTWLLMSIVVRICCPSSGIRWERNREVAEEYLLLRRCIETTIEAALRLEPRGPEQVDALAWIGAQCGRGCVPVRDDAQ